MATWAYLLLLAFLFFLGPIQVLRRKRPDFFTLWRVWLPYALYILLALVTSWMYLGLHYWTALPCTAIVLACFLLHHFVLRRLLKRRR